MAKTPSGAIHILKLDAADYSTSRFDATLCPSWEPLWLFHNWARIIVLDFFGHRSDRMMPGLTWCNVAFTEYGFCKVCLTSKLFRIIESKCEEQVLQIRFPTKVSTAVQWYYVPCVEDDHFFTVNSFSLNLDFIPSSILFSLWHFTFFDGMWSISSEFKLFSISEVGREQSVGHGS